MNFARPTPSVRPEPVEGHSFLIRGLQERRRGFDKLSPNGNGFTGLLALACLVLAACSDAEPRVLRVCADPNNLPFSNRAGEGFENKLAELVAGELGARLDYVWWAQRRGNVRETLNAGLCDLIPGVGAGLETLATTEPYYYST